MNRYTLRQKKSKTRKIICLTLAILVFLFAVIVVIGNVLKTAVASAQSNRSDIPQIAIPDSVSEEFQPQKSAADIKSGYMSADLYKNSSKSAIDYLKSIDCNAVTVSANDGFFWESEIKDSLEIYQNKDTVSLESAVGELLSENLYVSILYNADFGTYDGSKRELFLAYDKAILCELGKIAPNELLIKVSGTTESSELKELYSAIKLECPSLSIGVSIPYSTFDTEYYYSDIHDLYSIFDFIVFDFSNLSNATAYVEKASVYYSLYGARPAFSGEFIPDQTSLNTLDSIAVDFWQCFGNPSQQVIPNE